MADFEVHLDDVAIYDMLNGAGGPVWNLLEELSERAAAVARERVPVRGRPRSRRGRFLPYANVLSTAYPPGYTLRSIRTNVHWYNGLVYGGIAAAEEPTIFLEYPAEQMSRRYPFLSTAFDSLEI
jgi:hypothetical protein